MRFSFEGQINEDYTEPVMFQNKKKLYAASDVTEQLLKQKINSNDAKQFSNMEAKALFSRETTTNPSFHIYTTKAASVDGIYRICRISFPLHKPMVVEEFRGSRTPPYSALYPLLMTKMKKKGIFPEKDIFQLCSEQLGDFIECVNEVNYESNNECYELIPEEKKHSLIFSQKTFYYNIAYWRSKEIMDYTNNAFFSEKIKEMFFLIAESGTSDFLQHQEEIDGFFMQIDELSQLYKARKNFVSESQQIRQKCGI